MAIESPQHGHKARCYSIRTATMNSPCGLASVYTKAKVVGAGPIGVATGSQFAAGLRLSLSVPCSAPHGRPTITVVLCVLALAYLRYFRLIVHVGPAKALTVTFLVSIFGTLWGALFLGGRSRSARWRGAGLCWPARR